jgi:hypothetical protein
MLVDGASDFEFIPLRHGVIVESGFEAGFLFVDVKLGNFVDYDAVGTNLRHTWNACIQEYTNHPKPKGGPSEGFYIYREAPLRMSLIARSQDSAWLSVVRQLSTTPLADCVTYRVLGFYKTTGWTHDIARACSHGLSLINFWHFDFITRVVRRLKEFEERPIRPRSRGSDCWYELPMGGSVILRLIFYRDSDPPKPTRKLLLEFDKTAFTSSSERTFSVENRYDNIRAMLSCARISDPTYTTLSIVQSTVVADVEVWAAEPSFTVLIGPPAGFLLLTVLVFGVGLFLLNMTAADDLSFASAWFIQHRLVDDLPPENSTNWNWSSLVI